MIHTENFVKEAELGKLAGRKFLPKKMSKQSASASRISSLAKSPYFTILIACILICLILIPYATNGFWGDDALNSQIRFLIQRVHGSVWDFSYRVFLYWLNVQGRIMAVCFYNYPLYYVFHDLTILRLAQCVTVLLNIALFSYILHYLGLRRNSILIWAVLFMGLFQISDALDPTGAFAFHYQLRAIEFFVPLIFLLRWSTNLKTWCLILAMIFWFWSMLFYEVNIIFLAIAGVFILKKSTDRTTLIPRLFVLIVPVIAYALLNYYVRSLAPDASYSGSSFGQTGLIVPAYFKQLYSTFPLTFFFGQNNTTLTFSGALLTSIQSPLTWLIFIAGAVLFYVVSPGIIKDEIATVTGKFEVIVISLSMLLLPPVLPAVSARYQVEVGWGHATLPVYYQYFGAAMLILWLLSRINAESMQARILLSIIIGFYLAFNMNVNEDVASRADNEYYRAPRELLITQAHEGLFADVKDGDIVELAGTPHYVNANLIFESCGKNVFVPTDDHTWYPEAPSPSAHRFSLSRNQTGRYELIRQPENNP